MNARADFLRGLLGPLPEMIEQDPAGEIRTSWAGFGAVMDAYLTARCSRGAVLRAAAAYRLQIPLPADLLDLERSAGPGRTYCCVMRRSQKGRANSQVPTGIAVNDGITYADSSCHPHIKEDAMNRYTNVVLTVIAVALVALVFENATSLAHADPGITRVALCDPTNNRCASVGSYSTSMNTFFPILISKVN
jgi:hypothetical protein